MIYYHELHPLLQDPPNDLSRRKAFRIIVALAPEERRVLAAEVAMTPSSFLSPEWQEHLLHLLT